MACPIKKQLRNEIRNAGRTISPDLRKALSEVVVGLVGELPRFADARVVALFAALPDELMLDGLVRRWGGEKRFALPVVVGERMEFREYTADDTLSAGAFGIYEPRSGAVVTPREIELMLVPGVAFDRVGHRLGRGKGFYDTYLSMAESAGIYKVGVCFPHQLVGSVPCEPHDILMDEVITPQAATAVTPSNER